MGRAMIIGVALNALILAGCGAAQKIGPDGGQPVSPSNQPVTFFQNALTPSVKMTLDPDPIVAGVAQQIPHVTPPTKAVIVYLPVYPGATSTKPVTAIGDMGTPMDGDLVDGTLYFKSRDSQVQIKAWYTQQLKKLGYTLGGQGQSGNFGKMTSVYYDFTKGDPPGNPTKAPDINLGFLAQKQDGETIFKLKTSYIVTPTRPKDSYLPNDIVKVVLTNGKSSKTITDKTWITNVVQMMNELQVSTPGMSSGGPSATPGTTTNIAAKFYRENGSEANVKFSLLSWTVTIGNVMLNCGTSPTLEKTMESVFSK